MTQSQISIRRLVPGDTLVFFQLNKLFAKCFDDAENYLSNPPDDSYLDGLLAKENVISIVALVGDEVVGGLVAYELDKFEQQRREIYIYDLAVDERHRRKGIATGLIGLVRDIARERKAWMVYVQADLEDLPAVALYSKLGRREDVLHFDIDP